MPKNSQLTHDEHKISGIKFPLSIVTDNLTSPQNVGSLFRLCDALGIEKLYLCGDSIAPPNAKINKTSRSTEKYVAFEKIDDASKLIKSVKKSGAYIISLEITSSSLAIDSPNFTDNIKAIVKSNKPIYLLLGAEKTGINDSFLALSDLTIHITMHGHNSSMNVVSAASIACFEITREMAQHEMRNI